MLDPFCKAKDSAVRKDNVLSKSESCGWSSRPSTSVFKDALARMATVAWVSPLAGSEIPFGTSGGAKYRYVFLHTVSQLHDRMVW